MILVTGATGFIGIEVVRQLAVAGHRPRGTVRRLTRAPLLASLDVEAVHGDLLSTPSLARAVEGVDTDPPGRAGYLRALRAPASHHGRRHGPIGASRRRCRGGAHRVRIQHVRARRCRPGRRDHRAESGARLRRSKLAAETALAEITAGGGPTVAAVRLPHVYGPQSVLFGLARRRFVVFPGRGDNPFAQLHVEDAARVLIAAAAQGWAGTGPIADEHAVTWNEFFDVLTTYAPHIRVRRVPAPLATGLALLAGPLLGRLGPTLVGPDTVRGWNLSLPVTTRKLWNELDLEPRHPSVLSGIPATLDAGVAFRWRHPVFDWT